MKAIALTGNIASGKSTVARLLRSWGVPVIDLDEIVRELQSPGTQVHSAIADHFGDRVLEADGSLNRAALRGLVLDSPMARLDLEAIVHPAVRKRAKSMFQELQEEGHQLVVVEIPLLYETGSRKDYDGVILVDSPMAVRRARMIEERGIPPEDADRLLQAQMPTESKRKDADWIIDNDGDLSRLTERTRAIWEELQK